MSKFAELDAIIIGKLNEREPIPFHKIHFYDNCKTNFDSGVYALCEKLSTKPHEGFRVLDRRLQVLRKSGKIKSIPGKGWVKLIEEEVK